METINSFKGYGKVDPVQNRSFQAKTRRRMIVIAVSVVVLVAILISIVAATVSHHHHSSSSSTASSASYIKSICSVTEYPDTCFSSLSSSNSSDPRRLLALSLQIAAAELQKLTDLPSSVSSKLGDSRMANATIQVCETLIEEAIDRLNDSVSSSDHVADSAVRDDLRTWLSAAITDLETCFDSVSVVNGSGPAVAADLRSAAKNSSELVSNSLAIVTKLFEVLSEFNGRKLLGRRQLLWPEWVGESERRILQAAAGTIRADIVVAQDGSGDYKTISDAVAAVPLKNTSRFVIHVKEGVYVENVSIGKKVWNLMMVGDGMTATVVSGSLNFVDGTPTFLTATFAVNGQGFIAKSMGFKNTAGAAKHQAVAFRSGSDQSIYYQCLFDGYQDTLYSYSNRQFYRECTITGTIDFIFGNAAVVYQSCTITPRQPLPSQFNTITAQGKTDQNQDTGISIQKSTIVPLGSVTAQTYLGRPWKAYATTVFMESSIGSLVNPQGWIEWIIGTEPSSTIFYAEYQNTGAGANVLQRVKWAGVYPALTASQASQYTVSSFLGTSWLTGTNVAFDSTL
ncbi:Pectinesterase 3-like protein [Drosera capensis]